MYPNATLFNMAFVNVSRSDRYGEAHRSARPIPWLWCTGSPLTVPAEEQRETRGRGE